MIGPNESDDHSDLVAVAIKASEVRCITPEETVAAERRFRKGCVDGGASACEMLADGAIEALEDACRQKIEELMRARWGATGDESAYRRGKAQTFSAFIEQVFNDDLTDDECLAWLEDIRKWADVPNPTFVQRPCPPEVAMNHRGARETVIRARGPGTGGRMAFETRRDTRATW